MGIGVLYTFTSNNKVFIIKVGGGEIWLVYTFYNTIKVFVIKEGVGNRVCVHI